MAVIVSIAQSQVFLFNHESCILTDLLLLVLGGCAALILSLMPMAGGEVPLG